MTQSDGSGLSSFGMDGLYRLITADYPGTANDELYTYDKVGNRKTATRGALVANASTRYYNYTTGTNRLADIRLGSATGVAVTASFIHDDEGRLISQSGAGAKTLTWDAKGRVKTVGVVRVGNDRLGEFPAGTGVEVADGPWALRGPMQLNALIWIVHGRAVLLNAACVCEAGYTPEMIQI